MFLLNCRSFSKHSTELAILLQDLKPDALFLTEAWLHNESDPILAQTLPPGYLIYQVDRKSGRGGGIAIVVNNKCNYCIIADPLSDCESLVFSIDVSSTSTFSGLLIYHPPGAPRQFLDSFPTTIANLAFAPSNFTVLGDLNFHLDDPSDKMPNELIGNLLALQLNEKVSKPTHCKVHLLDPVFRNCNELSVRTPVPLPWSDHFLIPLTWEMPGPSLSPNIISVQERNWSRLPTDLWKHVLETTRPVSNSNLNLAIENFNLWIQGSLVAALPKQSTHKISRKNTAPWFSPKLRELKMSCRRLERRWRQDYSDLSKLEYREAIRS